MLTLVCILPAMLGGIVEDVTQQVKVRYRLGLTIGSALLVCWAFGLRGKQVAFALMAGMAAWALTAFLDKDRQFLHDRLAGTRLIALPKVVKK